MQFFANLQPQSMETFKAQKFQPDAWLLSTHRLSRQMLQLALEVREEGIPLFADNGTKQHIGKTIKRYRWRTRLLMRKIKKLSKTLDRSIRPEDVSEKIRKRALKYTNKVAKYCVKRSEKIDWQELLEQQLSMKPTHLIAQEDFTVACLIGLNLDREITGVPLEFFIQCNKRSLRLWKRVIEDQRCHGLNVYAVLSAVDYNTAFEAGKLAAKEGATHIAIGVPGIMLDPKTVDYFQIGESIYSLEKPVHRRYVRFAQIIRGITDGYRSMNATPTAFHVLGLGAPILFPVLAAAMDIETKLSIDSTSPIYIAVRQDTLFDPERDADRVSCIKIVERIVKGKDWPFLCPFCQDFREIHGHKPKMAQKWWKQAGKPAIDNKLLKPKKPLSRLLPLFANHKKSAEVDYCRIAHNHWVIDKFVHQVPEGSERKKWARKKISEMLSYESTLTARGLKAANQILLEKSTIVVPQ